MAIKVSTGLANEISDRQSMRGILEDGRMLIFSGTKPLDADTASSGTLLATITNAAGAFVAETLPVWTVAIAGSSGSISSIKMGGIELLPSTITWAVSNDNTASLIAAAITTNNSLVDYTATSVASDIFITGPTNCGASLNSVVCVATATTMTATPASAGAPTTAGVTAVNGLLLSYPAVAGVITNSGSWAGVGVSAGTASWFRYCCEGADVGTSASTTYKRIDGSITATGGGGDAIIDNTAVAVSQTVTVSSFTFGVGRG